jgi:hypothetical protein
LGRSSSRRWKGALDRAALAGLALGLALYVLPFWAEGRLRLAFWMTLVSTLLHVYTSHALAETVAAGGAELVPAAEGLGAEAPRTEGGGA